MTKNNSRYHCVEQRLVIKFMHMVASVSERERGRPVLYANHSTAQLSENQNDSQPQSDI